jgi:X-X-X-Leu-X-X-Gly heptad repeat protein
MMKPSAPFSANDYANESMVSFEDELTPSATDSEDPVSLEGVLLCRKGRSTGHSSFLWKKRFVLLDLTEAGSLAVYKDSPEQLQAHQQRHDASNKSNNPKPSTSTVLRTVYSKLHRSQLPTKAMNEMFYMFVPSHLPWVIKDVENDAAAFVLEIPTGDDGFHMSDSSTAASLYQSDEPDTLVLDGESFIVGSEDEEENIELGRGHPLSMIPSGEEITHELTEDLLENLANARSKGKPLRIYFRCLKGGNEKALWLRAFSRIDRLSNEIRKKKSLLASLTSPLHMGQKSMVRIRNKIGRDFARETRHLDQLENQSLDGDSVDVANDVEELVRGARTSRKVRDKEFRVLPTYAYPHRWMNRSEMQEEMVLPSTDFHDLRVPDCKQKEIGSLRVEVLQCLGLPKLDRTSDTDAVAYLVCGSYAFSTDVIPNRANPNWLRKSRRACVFPLFHAYARLYVGVFDDDGKSTKDDFAGRVVVDLARLRPASTYDVTLPLRLSTHVYSKRRRGAIRLRFTLDWNSERAALLSYIPKKIRIPLPQNSKPNTDTTVLCADPKAFRNIAITVHGAHLPGRFTFPQMRATIREFSFTRKYIFMTLRQHLREMRMWIYPSLSAFVFCAWMHCVYANAFSKVPAYLVVYQLLLLMQTYVKYGIDGPAQCGFIPPSWEEMFMALFNGNPNRHAIEPLEFGLRPLPFGRRRPSDNTTDTIGMSTVDGEMLDYRIVTHEPKGKAVFRMLGFKTASAKEDHLEFPFANGADYPKYTVKECLVERKGVHAKEAVDSHSANESAPSTPSISESRYLNMPRFPLDVEMSDIMRKDSSGLKDYDDEEDNFAARRAVMFQGKKAAGKLGKAASGFNDATGLHHVVSPIRYGITSGMNQVSSGMNQVSSGVTQVTSSVYQAAHLSRMRDTDIEVNMDVPLPAVGEGYSMRRSHSFDSDITGIQSLLVREESDQFVGFDNGDFITSNDADDIDETDEITDPDLLYPEQNIDIDGPSSGKKLTDEFAEIKDKMHEVTWHLFDDKTYEMKDPESLFFGQGKKPEKRRKAMDVSQKLDKLLHVGQYSHSNPFIARLGLFVEPIISSVYSFLCLFRAVFNVYTWRDPMLTFWLSVFGIVLAAILFVFPWRIFLFVLGVAVVGPQNWAIRVLRAKGHLPPIRVKPPPEVDPDFLKNERALPTGQPIFCSNSRQPGNAPAKPSDIDEREVQRIVVPYNPLIYQRFYDWPPEPQYAQVKAEHLDEQQRKALNSVAPRRSGSREVGRIRRRFSRRPQTVRSPSVRGLPPLNPRRRANTGDWQSNLSTATSSFESSDSLKKER